MGEAALPSSLRLLAVLVEERREVAHSAVRKLLGGEAIDSGEEVVVVLGFEDGAELEVF